MNKITTWLQGRKTYLASAAMFTLGLAALVNGWGEAEIAALAAGVGATTGALRAGVTKHQGAAPALTLALLLLVGCASLGRVDPATGRTPAQDIQNGVEQVSLILPPPFNVAVPIVTGAVLTTLIALGRAKESEAPSE